MTILKRNARLLSACQWDPNAGGAFWAKLYYGPLDLYEPAVPPRFRSLPTSIAFRSSAPDRKPRGGFAGPGRPWVAGSFQRHHPCADPAKKPLTIFRQRQANWGRGQHSFGRRRRISLPGVTRCHFGFTCPGGCKKLVLVSINVLLWSPNKQRGGGTRSTGIKHSIGPGLLQLGHGRYARKRLRLPQKERHGLQGQGGCINGLHTGPNWPKPKKISTRR